MRPSRLFISLTLALAGLIVLVVAMSTPLHAAPAGQSSLEPGDTVVPMGPPQGDVRTAYRDVLAHLYGGGRIHWAASSASEPAIRPGDFVVPGGLDTTADHVDLTGTLSLSRAYALYPGGVAVLRSTVVVTEGDNQMVAMWELAEVRQLLDGYLVGSLPYAVLDEAAIASGGLARSETGQGIDLLIVPAIRPDAVLTVTQALSETGALAAIKDFVRAGGTLYAQSNGAYVAEAAGLLPAGTVDLDTIIELDAGSEPNRGLMAVQISDSPLSWSWLTETLYILTDPTLHPSPEMEVVATLSNAGDTPAVVRAQTAETGEGQVILVVGHPTDEARRLEVPVFMDALLLALSSRAELTGDAVQTFNPAYDPHEFPAYEVVPVSATLTAANLWDAPIGNVWVTETVSGGYVVSETTISPACSDFYTVTSPTTATIIVWDLGELAPGAEVALSYVAESDPDALAAGAGTFSTGVMRYDDPELGPTEVAHRPFVLTAQMAARLVGDRDLEADRHYRIPAEGIYLDVALPLENKEWTLAPTVVVTDWVYLIYPFVDFEDQHVVLSANDGETIWMRNEPFLWGSEKYPLPIGETDPARTYTLDDWQGDWCVFTSTHGIHVDPPAGLLARTEDYGSFVTIPPTYTQYITVTPDHELLLPCLPLAFDLGAWPGYWYEEPAVRYGVHSRELFSRTVVFHGTPVSDAVVLPYDAGSLYVAAGADPLPFREYLDAAVPYAAVAPTPSGVTYQDVWSRTHFLPFRAAFYDTWDWDTCVTCGWPVERHAALNLTFGLTADLDGDGTPESPVREIPTRLPETWVTLMGKSYNLGAWTIPPDENLIELPIFHGLGVQIRPRGEDWFHSYVSPSGNTVLVAVTQTAAYDHLYFQQDVPPGAAEILYVNGTILTYGGNHEGMFKLHDGARLAYRQMLAGPNRYEIYDSHVHSVLGLSSDGEVAGWAGPTAVSVYGDSIYYVYDVDDRYDPRTFTQDPYMNSWGYGDFVATSYAGGREQKALLHSIVASGDRTRARIALDNNTGVTLTDVAVTLDVPGWITVTQLYTDPTTAPEPIWPELVFLNVETIPDAWRGVYYYDVEIGAVPADLVGRAITLPVQISATGLPAGYAAPPLVLGLRSAGSGSPEITFGPAHSLALTDTLPDNVSLLTATLVTQAERDALMSATDYDALHFLSDTAGTLFAGFVPTLPFTVADGIVTFGLPEEWRTLPPSTTLHVAASATITRAHHGPNRVGDGGTICYTDLFGLRWCERGAPVVVEAAGAAVVVDYFCEGGGADVLADGAGQCTVPPDETSEITLRITAYNEGDALAEEVTATLELPADVMPVGGLEPLAFGDVAPGGWANARVTLEVTPTGDGIEDAAAETGWQYVVVNRTWGQFRDAASGRTISGQLGDDYAVNVLWKPRLVYLPIVMRNMDLRPDLVVTALTVDADEPATVQVTIANRGLTTARDFWVDLYLDPASPPVVNQPWINLSVYGVAWRVDGELAPGESLTLTVGDTFYQEDQSRWPGVYPSGSHNVWAYVDSWGHPQPYGAVDEANEGNNRYGPVPFIATCQWRDPGEPESQSRNNRYGPVPFIATGGTSMGSETVPLKPVPPRPLRPGGGE